MDTRPGYVEIHNRNVSGVMIMFKMVGIAPNGLNQELTWDSGRIKGDKHAVADFLAFVRDSKRTRLGNMEFEVSPAKMLPAFALMHEYFGHRPTITGETPVLPSVPDGAIP